MINTLAQLAQGLTTLYPTAYSHFSKKQSTPFICYLDDGSNNLVADNIVVEESTAIRIELYTSKKDLEAERKIKQFLTSNEIPYEQDSTFFIESEKLFLCVFNINLIN